MEIERKLSLVPLCQIKLATFIQLHLEKKVASLHEQSSVVSCTVSQHRSCVEEHRRSTGLRQCDLSL
eukprot:m.440982 g.440982  ORF g.440982 m.440982 type:complete len:67 (+) comp18599_c0_seq1:4980-5180(+)